MTTGPNETPRHTFRYPQSKWDAAGRLAAERGETLTDVLGRALDGYLEPRRGWK